MIADTPRTTTPIGILLARATERARFQRVPYNPLNPDAVVRCEGQDYALTWLDLDFDLMSPSRRSTVTVTCRATGERLDIGGVWRKERRTKAGETKVTYTLKGAGSWHSYEGVCAGLVALAAERMSLKGVAA